MTWNACEGLRDRLVRSMMTIGLPVSFWDGPLLELEFDRLNETEFPSKYVILGLRVEPDYTLAYSIEPMFKPEKGDCRNDSWVSVTEKILERSKIMEIIRTVIEPGLNYLGLKLGQEVSEIHRYDTSTYE